MGVFRRAGLVLMVVSLWVGGDARADTIRVAGTGSGLALVRALVDLYHASHPEADVWIPPSVGSSGAVKGLAMGKLDVGILLRPLKDGEVEGATSTEICRTPLVFFTNAERPDVTLGRKDLAPLFGGTLRAFGRGEVRPLLRDASDTGFILLVKQFPDLATVIEQARGIRGANLELSDQDAMDAAERSRSLVGFGTLAPLLAEHRRLIVVPFAEGGLPNVPVVLALAPNPPQSARAFVDFAGSAAAAALLKANGCTPARGDGQ